MEVTRPTVLMAMAGLLCGLVLGLEAMSIDERILNASLTHESFNFFFNEKDHLALTEYDILIPQEEWLAQNMDQGRVKRGVAIKNNRWTNGVVKYTITPNTFASYDLQKIQESFEAIQQYTCIRFEEASYSDTNKVNIFSDNGCYSYVGMIGGSQQLSLGHGCRYNDIIIHELGHALGLHHEQNHPDRDQYVNINLTPVPTNMRHNFNKKYWSNTLDMGIPYDYFSIMHYSKTAFGSGQVTIYTRDTKYQEIIGSAKQMSFSDIKSFNIMYNCNARCASKTCSHPQGYVGTDCKCWCPNASDVTDVQYCDQKDRDEFGKPGLGGGPVTPKPATTKPPSPSCLDQSSLQSCLVWKQYNYCNINTYVQRQCQKTCNLC